MAPPAETAGPRLTRPTQYNIEDSNIALLGSDLEKHVREHAGDSESAWIHAGEHPGLQIWRIENFAVVPWPNDRHGSFYDGDAYVVLHTYKKDPEAESLSYDLHFWLGSETSQDEAGTAAYKTVELDDHLNGIPVQYRELQSFESDRFLSYFPRFLSLRGGVSSGFHRIASPPAPSSDNEDDSSRLYHIASTGATGLVVRELKPVAQSLSRGDVFVVDRLGPNPEVWQLNTKGSSGAERYKAAEFVRSLVDAKGGSTPVKVFDEGQPGAGVFLSLFGIDALPARADLGTSELAKPTAPILYRLSDASGTLVFLRIDDDTGRTRSRSQLESHDAFLLDCSDSRENPVIYIWIGKDASKRERKMGLQYAQDFLYQHGKQPQVHIIRLTQGNETQAFFGSLES